MNALEQIASYLANSRAQLYLAGLRVDRRSNWFALLHGRIPSLLPKGIGIPMVVGLMFAGPALAEQTGTPETRANTMNPSTSSPASLRSYSGQGPEKLRQTSPSVPTDEAKKVFYKFAACVVQKDPKGVRSYFLGSDDTKSTNELWPGSTKIMSRCLTKQGGGELSGKGQMFRGALAQQLYATDYKKLPNLGAEPGSYACDKDIRSGNCLLYNFASCLVRSAPDGVDNLMRTEMNTPYEGASFRALSPYYVRCSIDNVRLQTDKFNLKLMLANIIYRRALTGQNGEANVEK